MCIFTEAARRAASEHAWRGWNKHKHRLNWPQSASVTVSEPHRRRVQCKLSKHEWQGKPLIFESGHV